MLAESPEELFIVQIFPDRGSFHAVERERILDKKDFSFLYDPEPDWQREIGKDADIDLFRAVTGSSIRTASGIFFSVTMQRSTSENGRAQPRATEPNRMSPRTAS